jgi:hypothetical protein
LRGRNCEWFERGGKAAIETGSERRRARDSARDCGRRIEIETAAAGLPLVELRWACVAKAAAGLPHSTMPHSTVLHSIQRRNAEL